MKKVKLESKKQSSESLIERRFIELDSLFKETNMLVLSLFLIIAFFGVLGLIWMIPFPQFDFLVKAKAHTFLNWGSFFIAIVVYLYLKLAPTLSYAILFTIAVMSFFIVQLEYIEKDGGVSVVLVTGVLAFIGLVGLWLLTKEKKKIKTVLTFGPIWLWSKLFDMLKIKY